VNCKSALETSPTATRTILTFEFHALRFSGGSFFGDASEINLDL